jgi:peptidoglycan/LPS O-acetylase OafA/YrhL
LNLINIFQRSTNSKSFIPEIDGLRFFAIITVVFFHLNTSYVRTLGSNMDEWKLMVGTKEVFLPGWWLIRLDLGVKVFFAISGFILSLPFLKYFLANGKKVQLGDYLYRRLTRLEPPFIISLMIFYLVQVVILHNSFYDLIPHFWVGLLYSHVFVYGAPNPINPVTWSLETEAQFYLILPFLLTLIFAFKRKFFSWSIFFLLFSLSLFFKQYFIENNIDYLGSSIIAYFTNFATGGLFALLYLKLPNFFIKPKLIVIDFIGFISVFMLFYFYKPQSFWLNNLIFNGAIFLLMVCVFRGKLFNKFFTFPFVYLVGGMCYSIYLIHYAFCYLIVKFTVHLSIGYGYWADFLLQSVIVLPLLLLLSGTFYLLIEKPCMDKNWPNKIIFFIKNRFKIL